MKKAMYVAIVAVFMVVGFVAAASAAVGNDQQNSSYLVWTKIVNNSDPAFGGVQDTVITLFNDSGKSTFLHCFWMDEFQKPINFEIQLTRFQSKWFRASDGNGSGHVNPFHGRFGELKCWAINPDDETATYDYPTKKNTVTGGATIYDFTNGTAISYNAFGHRKIAAGTASSAELLLDGQQFDACPAYLIGTFMINGTSYTDKGYLVESGTTELTLAPCKQDLRINGRLPVYGKALLTVYDEDENGYSGAYICFKCWVETTLDEPPVTSGGGTGYKPVTSFFNVFDTSNTLGVYATVKIEPEYAFADDCNFDADALPVPFYGLMFGYQKFNGLLANSGGMTHMTFTPFNAAANGTVDPSVIYQRTKPTQPKETR